MSRPAASLRRNRYGWARRFIDEICAKHLSHPWFQPCHDFLDARPDEVLLRGEVGDSCTLEAVGRLHGCGLATIKEIAHRLLANPGL